MKVWIDIDTRTVVVNGREVFLSQTEFQVFLFLWNNQGEVFSKQELQIQALGHHWEAIVSNLIGTVMYSLRRKFAKTALAGAIQTKRGFGYRIHLGKQAIPEQLERLDALIQKRAISKDRYYTMRDTLRVQLQVQEQEKAGEEML